MDSRPQATKPQATKPLMCVTHLDGNIFMVAGAVRQTLRRAGMYEEAAQITMENMQKQSHGTTGDTAYSMVLAWLLNFVEPYFVGEDIEERENDEYEDE